MYVIALSPDKVFTTHERSLDMFDIFSPRKYPSLPGGIAIVG